MCRMSYTIGVDCSLRRTMLVLYFWPDSDTRDNGPRVQHRMVDTDYDPGISTVRETSQERPHTSVMCLILHRRRLRIPHHML
jgi:hypothetical protein